MGRSVGRIDYLDGWRGLSILLVLAGHFLFLKGIAFGPFGVECFFVLSGRLMAEILFVQEKPLGWFYRRRISRVYPALFVFVAAMVAAGVTPMPALHALTFTYNYAGPLAHDFDHIWSLCVEEHSYLLLGLIAWLSRRYGLKVLPTLWALTALSTADGIVSEAVFHQSWFRAYWRTDVHAASIFVSAAWYLQTRGRAVSAWATPLFGAAALALNLSIVPEWISYSAGTFCLAGSLVTLDRTFPAILRALSWKPLTTMGLLSYSVYLWQQPFYQMVFGHHKPYGLALIAVSVAVGWVSFKVVENPSRAALNRLGDRLFAGRPATAAA